MTKASDNAFPSLLITEGTEPSAPAAGKQRLYIDSTTHVLMLTNSSGTESVVGGGALGAWTDYTPTLTALTTNPTLGSSTVTGRYKLLDSKTGIVRVEFNVTTGGAWNAGSGEYRFSLPSGWTTVSGKPGMMGSAQILDSGTARYSASCMVSANATLISPIMVADASGTKILSHNVPITWATGDAVYLQIVVELA